MCVYQSECVCVSCMLVIPIFKCCRVQSESVLVLLISYRMMIAHLDDNYVTVY